jgi:hypothetical protein
MADLSKRLIFIELNEINFDIVEKYIFVNNTHFPSLKKLLTGSRIHTTAEANYAELEPWIQWPSVHTSKTYSEHGIFRLGDIVGKPIPQIFEQVEAAGYRVGAISPMNTENRLKKPSYFIPDPWTQTHPDSSWWSNLLSQAISQTVNDNAKSKITAKSALQITAALVRFARVKNYPKYFNYIIQSRKKPWLKALVLDLLLHDIHLDLFNSKSPNFSTVFFNAGAHIQHHYLYNAKPLASDLPHKNPEWYVPAAEDPLFDILSLYDFIVGEYIERKDYEIILATGLAQKPYDRVKFYYRLTEHSKFLEDLGVRFISVAPRMTRDFLIEFANGKDALEAEQKLSKIYVKNDGLPLFADIDNRGNSLFVTLTYPHEITNTTEYSNDKFSLKLLPKVSFVAIKNGMHQSKGYAFFTKGLEQFSPPEGSHVGKLGTVIKKYFDMPIFK